MTRDAFATCGPLVLVPIAWLGASAFRMHSAGQGLFALRPADQPWRDPALRRVFTLCLGVVLLA